VVVGVLVFPYRKAGSFELTQQYSSKQLVRGAAVLTVAALITKVLSALYRVPFQNLVGDIGFYIYQQVYPFFGIVIALSTYGFPVIISKLVAEKVEENDFRGVKKVVQSSFQFLCIVGVGWFLLIYFGASFIAGLMGDSHLQPLIQVISLSFLLVAPLSTLRGYYQGKSDMLPTAVSQVTEQTVRVVTILVITLLFVMRGYSLYLTGSGALLGSVVGGLAGVFLLICFIQLRGENLFSGLFTIKVNSETKAVWSQLIKNGTAICISGMLLVLLQFVDAFNVYSLLIESGMGEEEAKRWKGIYDRGQPFVQLGTVVATSISLAIVPLVTSAYKKGDAFLVREYSQFALKVSVMVGFAASLGLINIIRPTNIMLFQDAAGSDALAVFSGSIFFSCLILTFSGILQGIGNIYYPAFAILFGIAFKYVLNIVFIPQLGIMGASIATIFSLLTITVLMIVKVRRLFPIHLIEIPFYKTLAWSGIGMTILLKTYLLIHDKIIFSSSSGREVSAFFSISGVLLGGAVFITIFLRGNVLTQSELSLLPFGSKWVKVAERVKIKKR
jgi:O-antigen/teichoic acid export membrane protein